jgi:hypothetical protein
MSALVVVLGDNSPELSSDKTFDGALDENGVAWN